MTVVRKQALQLDRVSDQVSDSLTHPHLRAIILFMSLIKLLSAWNSESIVWEYFVCEEGNDKSGCTVQIQCYLINKIKTRMKQISQSCIKLKLELISSNE